MAACYDPLVGSVFNAGMVCLDQTPARNVDPFSTARGSARLARHDCAMKGGVGSVGNAMDTKSHLSMWAASMPNWHGNGQQNPMREQLHHPQEGASRKRRLLTPKCNVAARVHKLWFNNSLKLTWGALKHLSVQHEPMAQEPSPYSFPGVVECCSPRLWPSSWKIVSR